MQQLTTTTQLAIVHDEVATLAYEHFRALMLEHQKYLAGLNTSLASEPKGAQRLVMQQLIKYHIQEIGINYTKLENLDPTRGFARELVINEYIALTL